MEAFFGSVKVEHEYYAKTSYPHYLVLVEYDKDLTISFFSKSGVLLGGENFEKTLKLVDMIKRNTVKEYSIS